MGLFTGLVDRIIGVERDGNDWFYKYWDSKTSWNKATTQAQKLNAVLSNPAAMYIFLLLPELYSMGKYKLYKGDTEVEKDPVLEFLKNPNPMQTESQFKWDYMFWRKLGTANLYIDSQVLTDKNVMYFLSNDCLNFPEWFGDNSQTLFLTDKAVRQMGEQKLEYKTKSQTINFKYKQLKQFFDISNGINSWFSSPSRVDALYKIISNSEKALESKNINAEFASKFLVAGKAAVTDTSTLPMGDKDKKSIRDSMRGRDSVFPVKSMVDIKRFVEKADVLGHLDKAFMTDAFILGKMLNIPKDSLEMLGDSTYENQEKARASLISYCIQPDANDFCEGILNYFGLDTNVWRLELDYSHLPFVQVFEKEKAETNDKKANAFDKLVRAGGDPIEVAEFVGIDVATFGEVIQNTNNNEKPKE